MTCLGEASTCGFCITMADFSLSGVNLEASFLGWDRSGDLAQQCQCLTAGLGPCREFLTFTWALQFMNGSVM